MSSAETSPAPSAHTAHAAPSARTEHAPLIAPPRLDLRLLGVMALAAAGAGVITSLVLSLMHWAQHTLWHTVPDTPWGIFLTITLAGLLIAAITTRMPRDIADADLDDQIRHAAEREHHRSRGIGIAAIAIISVAAGGSLGPEAGIIAVVAELAALVTLRMKQARLRTLISHVSVESSLGAVYASPPGGALFVAEGQHQIPRAYNIAAAFIGFLAFLGVHRLSGSEPLSLPFPQVDGSQGWAIALAGIAAIGGLLAGVVFGWIDYGLARVSDAIPSVPQRVLIGSLAFAAACALWPWLMFSGEHELVLLLSGEAYANAGAHAGAATALLVAPVGTLLLIAVAKALATAWIIRTGWKGGSFFPLLLVGGAAGAAVALILTQASWTPAPAEAMLSIAVAAALSATVTAALRKPLMVLVVLFFIAPDAAMIPLFIGAGVGMLARWCAPEPVHH